MTKKVWFLAPLLLLGLFGLRHFNAASRFDQIGASAGVPANRALNAMPPVGSNTGAANDPGESNRPESKLALPVSEVVSSEEAAGSGTSAGYGSAAARSAVVFQKVSNDSGPSIGTVKVIGRRGCDTNTQGWYLGVGKPDEYDYSVSDDGETLVTEPKSRDLTGAFEFVQCADAGKIAGKRVRFSARFKAEKITDLAQLRLWGENLNKERITFKSEPFKGTFDWKEIAVEVDVAPEVVIFNYGVTFRSPGKLWISHPTFEVAP